MNKLQQLISKLNDQCEQNESALQMLVTLKQIEAELTLIHTVTVTGRKNPGISVVMPSMNIAHRVVEEFIQTAPPGHQAWMGDPLMEIPTLSHQPGNQEINDLIGNNNTSIND